METPVLPEAAELATYSPYSAEFRAYARAHGYAPDEQLVLDGVAWPGGVMTGFLLWISDQMAQLRRDRPEAFDRWGRVVDFAAWRSALDNSDTEFGGPVPAASQNQNQTEQYDE